jgi:hypothetical protein
MIMMIIIIIIISFSDEISSIGLAKCTKIVLKRGKVLQSRSLILDICGELQELEEGKTSSYLRTEGSANV